MTSLTFYGFIVTLELCVSVIELLPVITYIIKAKNSRSICFYFFPLLDVKKRFQKIKLVILPINFNGLHAEEFPMYENKVSSD